MPTKTSAVLITKLRGVFASDHVTCSSGSYSRSISMLMSSQHSRPSASLPDTSESRSYLFPARLSARCDSSQFDKGAKPAALPIISLDPSVSKLNSNPRSRAPNPRCMAWIRSTAEADVFDPLHSEATKHLSTPRCDQLYQRGILLFGSSYPHLRCCSPPCGCSDFQRSPSQTRFPWHTFRGKPQVKMAEHWHTLGNQRLQRWASELT